MAGGKQTPRQKMIGILYLVLLGLVALNVSDSILEAFKTLTDSLNTSTANVQSSVDATFASFEATKLKEEPERAKPIYDKAKQASALVKELETYVEGLKKQLEAEGGGYNEDTGDLKKRDNLDISPRIMIPNGNPGPGAELKKRINDTRASLLALLDEKERANVNFSLQAVDPKTTGLTRKTWEQASFGDGIPLTAALTALAKIQADTKNAESEMVKRILGKMDMAVVNLDQFAAVAVAPTSYIIQGQPYTAEVFLTAYDSKLTPSVSVNGSPLSVKDGKGVYTSNNAEGVYKWVGTIRVKQTDGSIKEYKTPEQTYQVAKPSATVSPTKMNVFYVGLPNPVDISAPGIPKDKIRISVTGGTYTGSNGQFEVNVTNPGSTATVAVSAEINGKVQSFGSSSFRVKRIPDPKPRFAGKSSGTVSAVILKNTPNLFAVLDDFVYDAKFTITRYNLVILKPRQDAITLQGTASALTPAMKTAMAGVTPGTRVFFGNIVAVGPDGSQRQLDDIVFTAN